MSQNHTALAILYFNKLTITLRCINSCLAAGIDPKNIFCFDNGSAQETYAQIKNSYPQINHLRSIENKGFSGGFNQTLKWVFNSGFQAVLFCTNDTIVYPQTLAACQEQAIQSQAGIIAPQISYLNHPDSIDSIGAYIDWQHYVPRHYQQNHLPEILIKDNDYIPGTALWISRSAFQTLNGCDESFHTYWEDIDLCFRAHQAGIILARAYQAKISHEVGQTCHKKPLYTTFYFQRNRIRFFNRHAKGAARQQAKLLITNELVNLFKKWQLDSDTKRLKYKDDLQTELHHFEID